MKIKQSAQQSDACKTAEGQTHYLFNISFGPSTYIEVALPIYKEIPKGNLVTQVCALRFFHINVSQVKSNIHLGVLPTACGLEYANNNAAAILSVSDEPFM